mgnify:CR=1 FL=1
MRSRAPVREHNTCSPGSLIRPTSQGRRRGHAWPVLGDRCHGRSFRLASSAVRLRDCESHAHLAISAPPAPFLPRADPHFILPAMLDGNSRDPLHRGTSARPAHQKRAPRRGFRTLVSRARAVVAEQWKPD